MGVTIYYEGTLKKSEYIDTILGIAECYAKSLMWGVEKYNDKNLSGIILNPHEKCECVGIVFDKKLKMSSYTKTQYTTQEIHYQIVILLYSLKKYFKKFRVFDETGAWDEYLESMKKSTNNKVLKLKELTPAQIQEYEDGYINDNESDNVDAWFWKSNKIYYILDFAILRDLMRKDLSYNKPQLITLSEIKEFDRNGTRYEHINESTPEIAILGFVEMWIKNATINKLTGFKPTIFAWIIGYGCTGFDGGYFNSFHRQTHKLFKKLIEETDDTLDEKKTLQIFYTLLDYFKIERKFL